MTAALRAALQPLAVEHLQELRDFGAPPVVQRAVALSLWVVTGRESTWEDALAMWTHPNSFDAGLRHFLELLRGYESSERPWEDAVYEFLLSEDAQSLDPRSHAAGAALIAFLTAALEHPAVPPA